MISFAVHFTFNGVMVHLWWLLIKTIIKLTLKPFCKDSLIINYSSYLGFCMPRIWVNLQCIGFWAFFFFLFFHNENFMWKQKQWTVTIAFVFCSLWVTCHRLFLSFLLRKLLNVAHKAVWTGARGSVSGDSCVCVCVHQVLVMPNVSSPISRRNIRSTMSYGK